MWDAAGREHSDLWGAVVNAGALVRNLAVACLASGGWLLLVLALLDAGSYVRFLFVLLLKQG